MDLKILFTDVDNPKRFIKANLREEIIDAILIFVTSIVVSAIFRHSTFFILGLAIIVSQFLIKRWISQIFVGGILITYGILFSIVGLKKDLDVTLFGILMIFMGCSQFWNMKKYFENQFILEICNQELDAEPNNPEIIFNKIAALSKLRQEKELIDSTKQLMEMNNGNKTLQYNVYPDSVYKTKNSWWSKFTKIVWANNTYLSFKRETEGMKKQDKILHYSFWCVIPFMILFTGLQLHLKILYRTWPVFVIIIIYAFAGLLWSLGLWDYLLNKWKSLHSKYRKQNIKQEFKF